MRINEGILTNFMEDMSQLMKQVRVNGLVLNDKVYLTESEVKESLSNYLKVYGNLDEATYFNRFNKRLEEFKIEKSEFKQETIYYIEV